MKHVFSNYLKKYWLNDINGKLKDVFHEINTSYNKSDKYLVNVLILNDFHILCTDLSTTEFYFQCYTNKHLMDVIKWINRNIIVNIESDVQLTTEIKMRIAIGMINKLVYQRRLSDSHGKHAVDSLIANIREIRNLMIDEELPF